MNRLKICIQRLYKYNQNPFNYNKLKFNYLYKSNLISNPYFSFSDLTNSKNKNIKIKDLQRNQLTNKNSLENLTNIRRHEKKSNFNYDQFNRIKIDPNDESFYGNLT